MAVFLLRGGLAQQCCVLACLDYDFTPASCLLQGQCPPPRPPQNTIGQQINLEISAQSFMLLQTIAAIPLQWTRLPSRDKCAHDYASFTASAPHKQSRCFQQRSFA